MQAIKIPVKYIDTTKYIATVSYDTDSDGPDTWGNFEIKHWRDIDGIDQDERTLSAELQQWLKDGKAFWVDKYEHGGSSYSLSGEGMQCRFDTSSQWGMIIFDDAYIDGISYDERRRYAQSDLREYTDWANGEVYHIDITTASGQEVDACSGFIGSDSIQQFIKDVLPDALPENIEVVYE